MLYLCAVVLAFCSITYELILGQSLAAFLGNTVLRYSVTIGLYLLSLGIGTTLAERSTVRRDPVLSLARIEIFLTLFGGGCVIALFAVSFLDLPRQVFSLVAHGLVIGIGILTGFELPLLLDAKGRSSPSTGDLILGLNYLGAFAGTLTFAFLFYPSLGLLSSAVVVGLLNAVAGSFLAYSWIVAHDGAAPRKGWMIFGVHVVLAVSFVFALLQSTVLLEWLLGIYLRT